MDLLTKDELILLINKNSKLSVSIYMPTYVSGNDTLQNQTRFRNLVREIKKSYTNDGSVNSELNEILKETDQFTDNYEFWQHQSKGLAMFLSKNFLIYFHLPISFKNFFSVEKNFYILPLLHFLNFNMDYYILYLSQKEISLYSGSNFDIKKVNIKELNDITNDEFKNREYQKQLQFYTSAGEGSRKYSKFYGTGAKNLNTNKYLLNFFNKIDKSITKNLIDNKPLILAGADYIFPVYRNANSYPKIMEDVIHGNPKELNKNDLFKKVSKIIKTHHQKEIEIEYKKVIEFKNTNQSKYTSDFEVVFLASLYGNIDELFLIPNKKIWGKFNKKTNMIEPGDKYDPETSELLNIAVINTLNNRGNVYILDCENKKYEKPIAARLRY